MAGKQAKILSDKQQKLVLMFLEQTRNPVRNKLIFLLTVKAGLRAKEVVNLTWSMLCDPEGNLLPRIELQDIASKGKSGRTIWLNTELLELLLLHKDSVDEFDIEKPIIITERASKATPQVVVNFFSRLYADLGFAGASSHSGRRTFITNAAKKISLVGGSLRDVQALAGHRSLQTTQRYIEADSEAQRSVVELV